MARKKTIYDELRNIRRRYERAAASLRKRAMKSNDAFESVALMQAAQRAEQESMKYYASVIKGGATDANQAKSMLKAAIKADRSEIFKASQLNKVGTDVRKNRIAKMLTSGHGGSVLYAAFAKKFIADDVPYDQRESYIMRYFGVDNMLDALAKFKEKTGGIDPVSEPQDEISEYERYAVSALVAARYI